MLEPTRTWPCFARDTDPAAHSPLPPTNSRSAIAALAAWLHAAPSGTQGAP